MTNQLPSSEQTRRPELSAKIADRKPLIIAIVSAIIIVLFFGLIIFLLGLNAVTTATIRDIALILLTVLMILTAFVMLVLVTILVYLVMKINDLVQLLNNEIKPLMLKVNETATMTKDTAKVFQDRVAFVSDEAVKPVVNIVSTFSAIKAILKTLFKRA